MSRVYTVSVHPPGDSWLASARHHDRRVVLAQLAIDAVSGDEEATLIAFPAGFFRAASEDARDRLAEGMLDLSRRAQLGVVFGIDVASEGKWAPLVGADASYAYAADCGRRAIWPARQVRTSTQRPPRRPPEPRCVGVCGQKVALVISAEAFNTPLRLSLMQTHPDLVLVLAHSPPSDRWSGAVTSWHVVGPTFVVAPTGSQPRREEEPWVTEEPWGWKQDRVAETADMTIRLYKELEAQQTAERIV